MSRRSRIVFICASLFNDDDDYFNEDDNDGDDNNDDEDDDNEDDEVCEVCREAGEGREQVRDLNYRWKFLVKQP